jgi:hypothetical protein
MRAQNLEATPDEKRQEKKIEKVCRPQLDNQEASLVAFSSLHF